MAQDSPYRLALMSVHPEFAEAILAGTKTVEFRKKPVAADVTHVAIYATQPVGRVVGIFSIEEQVMESPRRLWQMFKEVGGISRPRFFAYYEAKSRGVGIRVRDLYPFEEKLTLQDVFGLARPPQSFQYVSGPRATAALALANVG